MTLSWIFAALHLVAPGIGLGAVWVRGRMLQGELDMTGIRHVLAADTWWGIAAVLWIATGLVRTLAGVEKGTSYYLHNHVFWTKMALLGVILFLEVRPMLGLAGELERGNPA